MAKLSSSELKDFVKSAGIKYIPADQIFYRDFPYKVELSPKFKGLGGVSGKRGCQIDIADPVKGRARLVEFTEKMHKIFSNVEYRQEIQEFVKQLPATEYKTRMGGENNLFYFRDAQPVITLIDRYKTVINSVTGPLNTGHENTFDEGNIIMRDKLYFSCYRYMIEFPFREDFVETAELILEHLNSSDSKWRANRLKTVINFYDNYMNLPPWFSSPNDKIQLYLEDGNDYVYIKLLAAEYVLKNHKVVLFDELS